MLRVRIRRRAADHRAAARASARSRSTSPVTPPTSPTAQNIQLPLDPRSRTCPRSGAGSEAVGLSPLEACGDVPRVILGSPVAGIAKDEIIDPTPAHRTRSSERFIGDPRLSRTCRASTRPPSPATRARTSSTRSTTSPSSASSTPSSASATTCGSAAACPPTRCSAERLGAFDPARARSADVWLGVTSIFRDYGYRRLRTKARLKFLIADWGVEKFRAGPRGRVPRLASSPTAPPRPRRPSATGDHIGVHEQKDGRFYVGVTRRSPAAISGTALVAARRPAGGARHRARSAPTPHQKLVLILDVAERRGRGRCVAELDALGLSARPSTCAAAARSPAPASSSASWRIVETKAARRDLLAVELEERLAASSQLDTPDHHPRERLPELLRPHRRSPTSASRARCVLRPTASRSPGFQVHLGGVDRTATANFGRKLRAHKVTSVGLDDYVDHHRHQLPRRPHRR